MIDYIKTLNTTLRNLDLKSVERATELIKKATSIYVIGNGGSAAVAEHFATDLIKLGNKRAWALTNLSLITMFANDYGYNNVFELAASKYCSKGDLVFGMTTSGKSSNVLDALVTKHDVNSILVAGVGGQEKMQGRTSSIIINSDNAQILEDCFSVICHMISLKLMEKNNGK